MNITEVRVQKAPRKGRDSRLMAYVSITIDGVFVIRDIKIIEKDGNHVIAMPSRKKTSKCQSCNKSDPLGVNFCSSCGVKQPPANIPKDSQGRQQIFVDIAHPINSATRDLLQETILEEFYKMQENTNENE